jgi:hypothetical protein
MEKNQFLRDTTNFLLKEMFSYQRNIYYTKVVTDYFIDIWIFLADTLQDNYKARKREGFEPREFPHQ